MKKTIKLIKSEFKDVHTNDDVYTLTEVGYLFVNGFANVTKDLDEWIAVLYEGDYDYASHKAWGKTPKEAANNLLSNFDLKIGMEV
jgi:hypothetical protein